MKRAPILMTILVVIASSGVAQNLCPCYPHANVWIASPCATWNCALSAMVLADGDPYVLTLPTGSKRFPWVVARRVIGGSVTVGSDNPFRIEEFGSPADGAFRFASINGEQMPLLVTAVDGRTLIIYLDAPEAKRHPVHH